MSLLQMSLTGSAVILFIVVIRALAIHRLPKAMFPALWVIAALRLLLPFSIPLPFITHTPYVADAIKNAVTAYAPAPSGGTTVSGSASVSFSVFKIFWLTGLLLMMLYFFISYFRSIRKFRMAIPDTTPFVREWLNGHPMYRPLEVRSLDQISSPLTYGILKPVILLPKKMQRSDEALLRYVLTHEYIHIRRFDNVTKLIFATALCIHWFNPLVWLMYFLANRDMELSCDACVIRMLGETQKTGYALALIQMEKNKSGVSPLYSSFGKLAITERIEAIMKYKKFSALAVAVAFISLAGAAAAFATSDEEPANSFVSAEDGSTLPVSDNEVSVAQPFSTEETSDGSDYSFEEAEGSTFDEQNDARQQVITTIESQKLEAEHKKMEELQQVITDIESGRITGYTMEDFESGNGPECVIMDSTYAASYYFEN